MAKVASLHVRRQAGADQSSHASGGCGYMCKVQALNRGSRSLQLATCGNGFAVYPSCTVHGAGCLVEATALICTLTVYVEPLRNFLCIRLGACADLVLVSRIWLTQRHRYGCD
jgi:hypothetical protein